MAELSDVSDRIGRPISDLRPKITWYVLRPFQKKGPAEARPVKGGNAQRAVLNTPHATHKTCHAGALYQSAVMRQITPVATGATMVTLVLAALARSGLAGSTTSE